MYVKKVWINGTIYTMESEGDTVEAVLTEDGRIIACGSTEDLKKEADEIIDLQGAVMYPGFVDSHLHMIGVGLQLMRLDLSSVQSKEEMLYLLTIASQNIPEDSWLIAEGFNENQFLDPTIPTLQELDAIRQGPIAISRVCRHVYLGNTAALRTANLENYTDSDKGSVGRDEQGNLTGLVYEAAAEQLRDAQIQEGEQYVNELKKALNVAMDTMLSKGLTAGHTEDFAYYGPYQEPYRAYREVLAERQDFRCHLLMHYYVFEEMMEANLTFDEPFMECGAMKIFADGSFGGSTAALIEDYADQSGWKGTLIQTDEEMAKLFQLARKYDAPIAVHVIGDAAAEQVVTMMERYPAAEGVCDRLIHACLVNEDLLKRIAKLPVAVDVQPTFVTSDFPWVAERLGEARLPYAYAWKSLLEHGIPCAGSSDGPVERIDPLLGIEAAVTRKKDGVVYGVEQCISRFEAIQMYTRGGAEIIGKSHERGMIKEGFVADFSVFDRDLFKGTISEAQAVMTVVDGRIAYQQD